MTKLSLKEILLAGAIAAGASVVVNALLFFVFQAAGILVDTIYIQPGQALTVVPVVLSSIVPTLVGAFVFFLFERFTNNGFRIFSIISVVLTIASFLSPFYIPEVTTGFALVLCAMHVVVAGFLLYFLSNANKKKRLA